jgi:hypothetical protein
MPRKYIRKVHVLRAHTSDGERYVEVVRYDGITITGVRFRLTKNGLYQVLWPRTRHVHVMVARGVTRHVIEAFKRYLDVHPWAVESANDAERETALVQVRELEHGIGGAPQSRAGVQSGLRGQIWADTRRLGISPLRAMEEVSRRCVVNREFWSGRADRAGSMGFD